MGKSRARYFLFKREVELQKSLTLMFIGENLVLQSPQAKDARKYRKERNWHVGGWGVDLQPSEVSKRMKVNGGKGCLMDPGAWIESRSKEKNSRDCGLDRTQPL